MVLSKKTNYVLSKRGKRNKIKKLKSNNKNSIVAKNLGWSFKVRSKNFNKLLIKSHKKGIKKIIVDNYPDMDDVYIVEKEIKKINKSVILRS
tara:strand:- start:331 stop:606 length:276 start_codon:yes stop_codon:yes gene_type:complete